MAKARSKAATPPEPKPIPIPSSAQDYLRQLQGAVQTAQAQHRNGLIGVMTALEVPPTWVVQGEQFAPRPTEEKPAAKE